MNRQKAKKVNENLKRKQKPDILALYSSADIWPCVDRVRLYR